MHAHEQGDKAAAPRQERRAPRPALAGRYEEVLALQRIVGNAATAELLGEGGGSVSEVLRATGRPIDAHLRAEMEARFDADFSDVRLHTGEAAQRSATEIGARAYTTGSHVVIGEQGDDRHTLAHELTHVLQQRHGPVLGDQAGGGLRVSHPDDQFEQAAETTATEVMRGPAPAAEQPAHLLTETADHAGSGQPVQRAIVSGDGDMIETAAQVRQVPEFQGLSQTQLARIVALAQDPDELDGVEDALERTADTVVGAVDASAGHREGNFVASAWALRGNVTAYDPAMQEQALRTMLDARQVPADTALLSRSSITNFGVHVPHVHVLVPHPGPWINVERPNDLAGCLDRVLGSNSQAYVLTDNEPGLGYAAKLAERIGEINDANARNAEYRVLHIHGPDTLAGMQAGSVTNLGGAALELGHQPRYAIIRITRN